VIATKLNFFGENLENKAKALSSTKLSFPPDTPTAILSFSSIKLYSSTARLKKLNTF